MTKRQLIDEIRRFNTSADPVFLSRFDDSSLKLYLQRLISAQENTVHTDSTLQGAQKIRLRKAS